MTTNSQDKKAAIQAENDLIKLAERFINEVDKQFKSSKRQKEQKQMESIITRMLQIMRDNGASEQSIRKAFPGLAEFAKYAIRSDYNQTVSKLENPQPVPTSEVEAPGLFLSEFETQEVSWLWEKRIPLGKITILDGDPGMGKSLLAINVAARVSTGQSMPDGTQGKQGGVILVAPEDGASDTLRPRLEAAGGDPSCVLLLNTIEGLDTKKMKVNDRPFSLTHDLEILEAAIKRTKAILVVLDPLMAVLGHNIDSSRDQDVREIFTPLTQLAECTNCAVLIIRHLNKGASKNALYRGAGSIGIIAAARTGLIIARDPYEENRRTLATIKNNLSRAASNLSYQVVENESGIPYIQWLGENNYTLPALLEGGTNISIERHKILQVLKDAKGPLSPQEIAELTGQKYTPVRLTLSRMHEAREIARPYRGMYTTLNHSSLLQQSTRSDAKTSDAIDTLDTTDTSNKCDSCPDET
ncbi:MAG: AAA family ATPase [Ktedonobacteraceae bacterium]